MHANWNQSVGAQVHQKRCLGVWGCLPGATSHLGCFFSVKLSSSKILTTLPWIPAWRNSEKTNVGYNLPEKRRRRMYAFLSSTRAHYSPHSLSSSLSLFLFHCVSLKTSSQERCARSRLCQQQIKPNLTSFAWFSSNAVGRVQDSVVDVELERSGVYGSRELGDMDGASDIFFMFCSIIFLGFWAWFRTTSPSGMHLWKCIWKKNESGQPKNHRRDRALSRGPRRRSASSLRHRAWVRKTKTNAWKLPLLSRTRAAWKGGFAKSQCTATVVCTTNKLNRSYAGGRRATLEGCRAPASGTRKRWTG